MAPSQGPTAEEEAFRRVRAQHMNGFDLDGLNPDELSEVVDLLTQVTAYRDCPREVRVLQGLGF